MSTTNPALSQVLAELKTNNDLHARHDAAFQQLKERFDKLHMSAVNNNAVNDGQSRRVLFGTQSHSRSPSPGRYNWNNSHQQSPACRRDGPTHYNSKQCNRCGHVHRNDFCPAAEAKCHNCNRVGHFLAVCRSGRRLNHHTHTVV